jgi:hypothetical protein
MIQSIQCGQRKNLNQNLKSLMEIPTQSQDYVSELRETLESEDLKSSQLGSSAYLSV